MNLPIPSYGKTDKETIDVLMDTVFKLRKELEYILMNLDDKNIADGAITFSKINQSTIDLLKKGVDVVVSNTVIVKNLYAQKGYIADLTVDKLDTSDKVQNYLNGIKADVNYIRINNEQVEFLTATVIGTETDHIKNDDGQYLYWESDDHTGITTTVNDKPVLTYVYDESIKMKFDFIESAGIKIPRMVFGKGVGNVSYPDRGKGFVYKDTTGLVLEYITSTGLIHKIKIGENGIIGTGNDLVDLKIYSSSMIAKYSDDITYTFNISKDINGKITQIENVTTGVVTTIQF